MGPLLAALIHPCAYIVLSIRHHCKWGRPQPKDTPKVGRVVPDVKEQNAHPNDVRPPMAQDRPPCFTARGRVNTNGMIAPTASTETSLSTRPYLRVVIVRWLGVSNREQPDNRLGQTLPLSLASHPPDFTLAQRPSLSPRRIRPSRPLLEELVKAFPLECTPPPRPAIGRNLSTLDLTNRRLLVDAGQELPCCELPAPPTDALTEEGDVGRRIWRLCSRSFLDALPASRSATRQPLAVDRRECRPPSG